MNWLRFWGFQVTALTCTIIGWMLLIPLSALCLWKWQKPIYSNKYPLITAWRWKWVDDIWGNGEDGVTGDIWYLPNAGIRLRTYLWCAWRNSANNLRWHGLLVGGPFFRVKWKGWIFQMGYRPHNGWPVLRLVKP